MALAKNTSDTELKDLPKWKKIEEGGSKIVLKRYIDNEEVVTKKELSDMWGMDRKTIERYVKKGMQQHESSIRGFQVFAVKRCEEWVEENINKSQSLKANAPKTKEVDISADEDFSEEELDLESVSTEEAERRLKIKENKIKEFKIKELSGEFIKAETTDKITAEMGAAFIGWLVNSRETLSRDLEHKTKGEIFNMLDEHFGTFINDMEKRTGIECDEDSLTLYEALHIVQHKLGSYKQKIYEALGL